MPPVVVSNREEDSMNNEPSLSGRSIIGLIYPPPDIRAIVDKTATFVARNGADFENKIREKESKNAKFNFLSPTDPYNAYYKHKVKEFQEGKAEAPAPKLPEAVKEAVKQAEFIPTRPPPAFEFSHEPATINAFDLDLIKTTAIFVARNGRNFLTQLMTREARNYQFDFLKPAHSNFSYFTKLVEQYTKVIIPSNNILTILAEERSNKKRLLDDIRYRVAWEKHQKTLKDKQEKEAEKERQAYASIDWHDFVVVQTVDFQPGDIANLPGLCTPQDVGARILLEQRQEQPKNTGDAVAMDMEESDSEDEQEIQNEVPEAEFATPLPPTKEKNILVRDYDPKKSAQLPKKAGDKWLISPLTGERIPSDKLAEHMRYNTVDAQYKEDRDRLMGEKGSDEPVLAPGPEISKNLERFAERRTDIFGVGAAGAEQTIIGRKLGEEGSLLPNKPIWDGSEESRDLHTQRIQNQVTLDQQIQDIHRQHGFLQDPAKERIGAQPVHMPPPGVGSGANAIPVMPRAPIRPAGAAAPPPPAGSYGGYEGPPAKRQRTEEELEPTDSWLAKNPGPVDLRIQLPQAPEFNLTGSIVAMSIELSATVADLKQMIQDKFTMPVSKQKLSFDGFFLKDQCQLAYYNLSNQSFVVVAVKERGGKNK